jgi:hypothetical protein
LVVGVLGLSRQGQPQQQYPQSKLAVVAVGAVQQQWQKPSLVAAVAAAVAVAVGAVLQQ